MEIQQRIQTQTRRDAEEVNSVRLTKALAVICLLFTASATAQTKRAPLVIKDAQDFHHYALYCPKPDYPINLRERRIGGSGTFMLHFRQDGTVEYVETL
jgi:hypothetical protein